MLSSLPSLRTTTRLVVLEGPFHGRQFSLGRQITTIGRSIGCHITVEATPSPTITHGSSGRPADGRSSRSETAAEVFVNDEPVAADRALTNGDVIRIGPARLRFESTSQAD